MLEITAVSSEEDANILFDSSGLVTPVFSKGITAEGVSPTISVETAISRVDDVGSNFKDGSGVRVNVGKRVSITIGSEVDQPPIAPAEVQANIIDVERMTKVIRK